MDIIKWESTFVGSLFVAVVLAFLMVAAGGFDSETEYGGKISSKLNLDFMILSATCHVENLAIITFAN